MPRTLLFDRSDRVRLWVSGPQAVASINGLVTNDVAALVPGRGHYAAILTAKGKILADLRVLRLEDGLLLDCSAAAAPNVRATLTKYVNPRFAKVSDESAAMTDTGVFGGGAGAAVAAASGVTPEALAALPAYGHVHSPVHGGTAEAKLLIVRIPDLAVDGFEVLAPPAATGALRDALAARGATPADAAAWRALRIAAGRPEWGVDMTDDTLPQEANFDELGGVSYDKGCYVGQETVARIHFRGHVNKTLRRLALTNAGDAPCGAELLAVASDEHGADAPKVVGDLRSVAHQSDGRLLAIGMVRREIETGATLAARWTGGEAAVAVLGPATGNEKGAID